MIELGLLTGNTIFPPQTTISMKIIDAVYKNRLRITFIRSAGSLASEW